MDSLVRTFTDDAAASRRHATAKQPAGEGPIAERPIAKRSIGERPAPTQDATTTGQRGAAVERESIAAGRWESIAAG